MLVGPGPIWGKIRGPDSGLGSPAVSPGRREDSEFVEAAAAWLAAR